MLQQEINEVIEKNLPQQVGKVLQEKLAKADKDANELETKKEVIKVLEARINELNSALCKHSDLDSKIKKNEDLERELSERERNFKIILLENKLEVEKEKSEFAKAIGLGLVRNLDYRKTIFDSENQAGYYQNNEWVQPSPINKNLIETKHID
mgnify:CR=1 FL=1